MDSSSSNHGGISHGLGGMDITRVTAGDTYKPVRRWLFPFPQAIHSACFAVDNAITRFVQRPLRTVGGESSLLEKEILQSNEISRLQQQQQQQQQQHYTPAAYHGNPSDSINHDGSKTNASPAHAGSGHASGLSSPSVLRGSLAITWRNKLLVLLALCVTSFTTIELGVVTPLCLFLLGFDELATSMLFSVLCAAVGSQVFKRFVWRARPWMAGRAIATQKRDRTSSFPSRAVLCAVVYAYLLAHVFHAPQGVPFPLLALFVVLAGLLAAIARIFVGAHYASDCLAGFVLGCAFCAIGHLLSRAVDAGCASCAVGDDGAAGACYAASEAQRLTVHSLSSLNLLTLFFVSAVSCLLVGLAMSSPLLFWQKCLPIFGLLAPTFAFRISMLCPSHNDSGVALFRMAKPEVGMAILGVAVTAGAFFFAKLVNRLTAHLRLGGGETGGALLQQQLAQPDADQTIHGIDGGGGAGATARATRSRSGSRGSTGASVMSDEYGDGYQAMPLDSSQRLLLQCSSFRGMILNLLLFLVVYTAIFVAMVAWRVGYAKPHA